MEAAEEKFSEGLDFAFGSAATFPDDGSKDFAPEKQRWNLEHFSLAAES